MTRKLIQYRQDESWESLRTVLGSGNSLARRLPRRVLLRTAQYLRSDEGYARAAAAAGDACVEDLAELFYSAALSSFAVEARASENIYVRQGVPAADAVFPRMRAAAEIARCFVDNKSGILQFLDLAQTQGAGGRARRRSRDWCEAAVALSRGKHFAAMELLAAHLLLEGRVAAALVVFNRIAATSPSERLRAFSLSNCAKALLDLRCPDAAADACEEALRMIPGDGLANANLAISKLLTGDISGAERSYVRIAQFALANPNQGEKLARMVDSDLRWASRHGDLSPGDLKKIRKSLKGLGLARRKGRSIPLSC